MSSFQYDLIIRSMPLLAKGAWLSVQILLLGGALSLTLGTLFGITTCSQVKIRLLKPVVELCTFFLRAVPFYVQLLIWYFVLPDLLGINIDGMLASILALGICSSGYVAQIVRGGINAIAREQWEAAYTLGYSTWRAVCHIIFPQMIRNILPALTSELDSLLKSTSVLASIGMLELTRMGMNIVSREMAPLEVYLAVAAFYALISLAINLILRRLERRLSYATGV